MIRLKGYIQKLPWDIKVLMVLYLLVTSIGFISALTFVNVTTENRPMGIQENYLGNEDDPEAKEMKFEKSEKQILNIIHTHMLAVGMLFFILAFLFSLTPIEGFLRKLLLFEPLMSVLFTFGGIYLLWRGILWMKYIIMISGLLMSVSYVVSVGLILFWIFQGKSKTKSA